MGLSKKLKSAARRLVTGGMLATSLLFAPSCGGDKSSVTEPSVEQPSQPKKENHPVAITSTPMTSGEEGDNYFYAITANDPDGDYIDVSADVPSWMGLVRDTLRGTFPQVGRDTAYDVAVYATDHIQPTPTKQSFSVLVKDKSSTHALDANQLSDIDNVDANTITFSNQTNFKEGDFVIAGVSDKTPSGLIRRITSVSADTRTIATQNSSLGEAVSDADLSSYITLTPQEVSSFSGSEGVSRVASSSPLFQANLNHVVLFDADGNPNTKDDQIVADGSFSLDSDFAVNLKLENHHVSYFTFENFSHARSDVSLKSTFSGLPQGLETKIAEYTFSPIVVTAGIFPVVLAPEMEIYARLKPHSTEALEVRVSNDAIVNTGVSYWDGKGWSPSGSFTSVFDFDSPRFQNNEELEFTVGPKLSFKLYGIAGPFGELGATTRFKSEGNTWHLYGGFEGVLGVDMGAISSLVPDYSALVLDREELIANGGGELPPSSEDRIAFVRINGNSADIYFTSSTNTSQNNLTSSLPRAWNIYPSFSFDGKNILFSSKTPSSNEHATIYGMEKDGSNKRQIGEGFEEESYPVLSPDGSQIAYVAGTYEKDLYLMASDGSNKKKILGMGSNDIRDLSWSPSGDLIAFSSNRDGNPEIYTINTQNSLVSRITKNSNYDLGPEWSSDGRQIIFSSDRSGVYDVWSMNSDGSNPQNITSNASTDDMEPCWSSDNKSVFYVSRSVSSYVESNEIWKIDLPSHVKFRITNNSYNDSGLTCAR